MNYVALGVKIVEPHQKKSQVSFDETQIEPAIFAASLK